MATSYLTISYNISIKNRTVHYTDAMIITTIIEYPLNFPH